MQKSSETNTITIAIGSFHDYIAIVQQYYKLLHRYACWVIPFRSEAEQIVAWIIFDLWEHRKRLHTPDAIRDHLKKHVKYHCMNWLYYKAIDRNKKTLTPKF